MTKPRGYRQSAIEAWFGLVIVCIPYYQALLIASMSGLISALVFTCLLLFVIARAPEVSRIIKASLRTLPLSWLPPRFGTVFQFTEPRLSAPHGPTLPSSFQRPPPLFAL
jgi:hypothetical protein